MPGKYAITFNAPFTLWFSFICLSVYLAIGFGFTHAEAFFVLKPAFDFSDWQNWFSLFGYAVGHANLTHLLGNLSFILLLGPMLEQKYGMKDLSIMVLITVIITALANLLVFKVAVLGSSGIVFMLVMLTSFANMKRNTIPLTFLLVAVLFLGKEVVESYQNDNVAQFGHIIGGICGSIFGFKLGK